MGIKVCIIWKSERNWLKLSAVCLLTGWAPSWKAGWTGETGALGWTPESLELSLGQPNVKSKLIDRKYKCDVCFKLFQSPSKLLRHGTVHTGMKPYKCQVCDKLFSQIGHCKTHLMMKHGIKGSGIVNPDYHGSLDQPSPTGASNMDCPELNEERSPEDH